MSAKASVGTMPSFERYAVIQTGGKQYQAIEGKTLAIEKLDAEVGAEVVFNEVLLRKTAGEAIEIGAPYVATPVKGVVVKHIRGPKLIVFKFKRRKKVRRKQGHRQDGTVVRIQSV